MPVVLSTNNMDIGKYLLVFPKTLLFRQLYADNSNPFKFAFKFNDHISSRPITLLMSNLLDYLEISKESLMLNKADKKKGMIFYNAKHFIILEADTFVHEM